MKSLYRLLLGLLLMLATLFLMNCSAGPGCPHVLLGSSTCTPGTGGLGGGGGGGGGVGGGGGGGGGGAVTANVYAVDQGGTVDGYTLNATAGTFQAISGFTAPTIPLNDPGVGMVVVQKQFVYALFEPTNEIFGWSIDSTTGALTSLSGFPVALALNLPLVGFNQYNVTTDPAGKYLFIADTAVNAILVYTIDSTTGALTAAASAATPIAPGNLATDGLGKYLYVCDDVSGHTGVEVLGYSIGSGGALALIGTFNFPMWQLQGDASGNFMIGTSGNTMSISGADDNHLYVFTIGANGALTQAIGSPIVTLYSPFTIAMQPPASVGEFVYSLSINDAGTALNPIEGFQLNTTTGAMTTLTASAFEGQWAQFDESGANLIVYTNTSNGSSTVTQLAALAVAADGTLTQPVAPVTLVTPGYWVVTDTQ